MQNFQFCLSTYLLLRILPLIMDMLLNNKSNLKSKNIYTIQAEKTGTEKS